MFIYRYSVSKRDVAYVLCVRIRTFMIRTHVAYVTLYKQLAKMSIDLKFVELTADVLEIFVIK